MKQHTNTYYYYFKSLCFVLFFFSTDAVDASLLSDLSADLLGLEDESWSLAVSPEFCKQHDRHTVKRQDVIYGEPSRCSIFYFYVFVAGLFHLPIASASTDQNIL